MTNNNAHDAANNPQANGPFGQGSGPHNGAPGPFGEAAGPYGDGGKNQTLEKTKSEVTQTAITTIIVALISIFAHTRAAISDSDYMYTMFSVSSEVGDSVNIIILVGLALVAAVLAGLAGFMSSIGVAKRRLLAFSSAGVFAVLLVYGAYAYFAKSYLGQTFGDVKEWDNMSWGFGTFMFLAVVVVGIISAIMLGLRIAKLDTWADGYAPAGAQGGHITPGYAQQHDHHDDIEAGQPGYGPGYGHGQPAQQTHGTMEANQNLGDQGYRHSADTGYIHGTGQNFDDPNQIEENPNR